MSNPTQQSVLNKSSRDKFILVLDIPNALRGGVYTPTITQGTTPIEFAVFGTIVPDVIIPTIAVPFAGQTLNVTSYTRPNYNPLTLNFVVDNTFLNYWILWNWLNVLNTAHGSIYGGDSPTSQTGLPEYQTLFSIFAVNEYNQRVAQWTYYNATITTLGGITYSYRESSWIESTATFQFNKLDFKLINPAIT